MQKWLSLPLIAGGVITLDQITKLWVVNNLVLYDPVPLLEALQPYLQITRTTNTGFAFGMGSGGSTIILILSSCVTMVLLWMYAQSKKSDILQQIALSMLIGGALGNIIDRIRLGHVVDFVHITIPGLISNVSNFADHFVVIGVGLLLLDGFLQESRKPKEENTKNEDSEILPAGD